LIEVKVEEVTNASLRFNIDFTMKLDLSDFQISSSHSQFEIHKFPTKVKALYRDEDHYHSLLQDQVHDMRKQQTMLYASNSYSVLIIFQAMDAAGKDGAIKHVMSGINPQGCQVYSFKHPSQKELQHDFLWRTTQCLPERGQIGIFNRSYYEEVLIAKVHPHILEAEGVPHNDKNAKDIWGKRYESIVDFEKHLDRNGTKVIKIFLHLSKAEQKKRFLARIDDTSKNWKFSDSDIVDRRFWNQYMSAYQDCINQTSRKDSPWHIVPADDKFNARLIISEIVLETMKSLKVKFPKIDAARAKQLKKIRRDLLNTKD
jgi:PPK2 family polyphosphate:nucleotide phosphotransferase